MSNRDNEKEILSDILDVLEDIRELLSAGSTPTPSEPDEPPPGGGSGGGAGGGGGHGP